MKFNGQFTITDMLEAAFLTKKALLDASQSMAELVNMKLAGIDIDPSIIDFASSHIDTLTEMEQQLRE